VNIDQVQVNKETMKMLMKVGMKDIKVIEEKEELPAE
jgi:hypothetical protein